MELGGLIIKNMPFIENKVLLGTFLSVLHVFSQLILIIWYNRDFQFMYMWKLKYLAQVHTQEKWVEIWPQTLTLGHLYHCSKDWRYVSCLFNHRMNSRSYLKNWFNITFKFLTEDFCLYIQDQAKIIFHTN